MILGALLLSHPTATAMQQGSAFTSTRCQQQQTPPSMAPCLHHHVTSHASVLLLLLLSYPTALATEAKPLAGGWLDWLARYSQQQARVSSPPYDYE